MKSQSEGPAVQPGEGREGEREEKGEERSAVGEAKQGQKEKKEEWKDERKGSWGEQGEVRRKQGGS